MTIGLSAVVLFVAFLVLLFLGVPISVGLAISSILTLVFYLPWDQAAFIVMQKMNNGVDSFSLLAVPLFIFAGNIMNNGGIARRLINFAQIMVGRVPGSLMQTNVVANMLFGALSGSAVAAAAAVGSTMYEMEKEEGYDPALATAVNIASAPTGLLIPPTTAFIVYSTIAGGVSVSALFMAGYIPGILMGISTMIIAFFWARRLDLPKAPKLSNAEKGRITLQAIPALLLIIIVIGGIVSGVFTATEGAAIAVLYCLILAIVYRAIDMASFMQILLKSAATSGIILFLISASSAMSWVMSYSGIPQAISEAMLGLTDNKYVILFLMNIILLIVGMFMDITPAILIFTPIFMPIATEQLGMSAVHFGVMLIFNMCMGSMTPPVGSVLFVGCGISGVTIEQVAKPLVVFLAGLLVVLMLVTYIPGLSLWIPQAMGLA